MGCCCSTPEHPKMKQVYVARDYGTKARLVLEVAGDEEKHGSRKQAIVYYGLHLRYMAVHVFKEVARRRKDEMLNMAQSCRRICTHRAGLQRLAVHKSQQSCCGSVYIPLDPAAPSQLAPWEWKGWLEMCKGTGDIETALMKLGLIKMEARETVALRLAEASRANVNVALSQQCNPNINVNPNISGPTTNISGPTTTVNPSIVSSNAQTGEGAVQPTVGADTSSIKAAGSSVAAPPAMPAAMPPASFMMMPAAQGPHGQQRHDGGWQRPAARGRQRRHGRHARFCRQQWVHDAWHAQWRLRRRLHGRPAAAADDAAGHAGHDAAAAAAGGGAGRPTSSAVWWRHAHGPLRHADERVCHAPAGQRSDGASLCTTHATAGGLPAACGWLPCKSLVWPMLEHAFSSAHFRLRTERRISMLDKSQTSRFLLLFSFVPRPC